MYFFIVLGLFRTYTHEKPSMGPLWHMVASGIPAASHYHMIHPFSITCSSRQSSKVGIYTKLHRVAGGEAGGRR
jgi:hypothetical protein